MEARPPALLVVDAFTEVLADADLNENSGTDIEKWSKAYITPLRRVGCTTVILDHVGHTEVGRPVSSRQKSAAAKVMLGFHKKNDFGRETLGLVEIDLTKNTVDAPIPEKQSFDIGGTPEGFVIRMHIPNLADAPPPGAPSLIPEGV